MELCAGTGSFSKIAREMGFSTYTVEINPDLNPDYAGSIMDFDPAPFVGKIDVMWASPPCTEFSYMTRLFRGTHTLHGLELVHRCLEIMRIINPKWWVFENPVGTLKDEEILKHIPMHTVNYCMYGYPYKKPTNIWTNIPFKPRECKGDCGNIIKYKPLNGRIRKYHRVTLCPKRKKKGTTGETHPGQEVLSSSKNYRSVASVPPQLVREILTSLLNSS
jgi:hypothetical protein